MLRALRNIWENDFFKNVATLISGTTFAQAFSILIYIFLSRIYTEEDFGVFGLYMNILNITIIFSTAKYELAILLPRSDRESTNLLGLSGLISLGVSLLLLLIVVPFNTQIGKLLGSGEIAGANIGQSLGNSLMKLVLGLLIVGAAGLIFGVVFGQLIGILVFLAIHLRFNSHKAGWLKLSEMKRLARQYSLFPRYNMWQGLINNFSGALPVFIFSSFFSTAIAGIYTFGYMILYRPVSLVANAFYQVMYQRFVEKQHQEASILPEVKLFIRRTSQVLFLPFLLMGFFAPQVCGFIFGADWVEAGRYAQILLPWIFMVSLVMPLSFIPDLYKKQRVAMIIDGVKLVARLAGLVVGVVLNNVYIGLALYSGLSTLVIGYSLIWYIRLVKDHPPEEGVESYIEERNG